MLLIVCLLLLSAVLVTVHVFMIQISAFSLTSSFIKINKSSVANISKIKKFISTYSGAVNVEFKSGYNDYVSRRCLPQVKRRLIKWENM